MPWVHVACASGTRQAHASPYVFATRLEEPAKKERMADATEGAAGAGGDYAEDGGEAPEGWEFDWCHVAHELQARNAELLFMIDKKEEELEAMAARMGGTADIQGSAPADIVVNETREAKITQLAKKVRSPRAPTSER